MVAEATIRFSPFCFFGLFVFFTTVALPIAVKVSGLEYHASLFHLDWTLLPKTLEVHAECLVLTPIGNLALETSDPLCHPVSH